LNVQGVELLDGRRAAELLETARKVAEVELQLLAERETFKDKGGQQEKEKQAAAAHHRSKTAARQLGGCTPDGDFLLEGFHIPAGDEREWGAESWLGPRTAPAEAEELLVKDTRAPEDATFETLKDGSFALIVPPGKRLKIDLSALLEGGDANKEQREKEARRRKKRRSKFLGAWGGFGALSSSDKKNPRGFAAGADSPPAGGVGQGDFSGPLWQGSWKEWVNEYTVTMDIKIQDTPPREGLALFQTALVHAEENKKQNSRGRLKQSDGEAMISPGGGVGVLGFFGDTKASVKPNRWHRKFFLSFFQLFF